MHAGSPAIRGFGSGCSATVVRPRRRVLALEGLEDRLAPAIGGLLSLSGPTLIYTAFHTPGLHQINVSTSGSNLVINDLAGTILSTVPGFSGSGTTTVSGAVPSFVSNVNVQANSGNTIVDLGFPSALSLSSDNLTVTAKTIATLNQVTAKSFTANAGAGTTVLGANVSTIGGGQTFNGGTTLGANEVLSATGGDIALNGNLTGGSHPLTVNDNGGSVTSAGAMTGLTALTIAPAQNITLGATSVAGPVVLTANGAVTLNGALTDTGSTVTIMANWAGAGSNNFTMNFGGSIGGTPSNVTIDVNNGAGTGSAIVGAITTTALGTVTINTQAAGSGGAIIDGNGPGVTNVTAASLTALAGPGGINLDTNIATLTNANTQGAPGLGQVAIRNTGQALAVNTVATSNGPISISNNNILNINGAVVANGAGQNVTLTTTGAGNNVNFGTVGFANSLNGVVTVNSAAAITPAGSGDDIRAKSVVLNAVSGIGTGVAPVQVSTSSLSATNTTSGNIFITTTNSLGGPTTATVTNSASPGNITLTQTGGQLLTVASATTVNGMITVSNAGDLTAVNVASGNNQTVSLTTTAGGNLALGSVSAGTGIAMLASAGNITDLGNDALNNVTAGTVNFVAMTGIGSTGVNGSIETMAGTVTATFSPSGGIFINSLLASPVNFGTVAPGIVAGGSGHLELRAAGAATLGSVAQAVSAANGTIFASSGGTLSAVNVTTGTNNNITLQTTGGDVLLSTVNAGTGVITVNSSGAILDATSVPTSTSPPR